MRVLVTGGAGYIGSHTVIQLAEAGHEVVVVDNFSNSKPAVITRLESILGHGLPLHTFDLCDVAKTSRLFAQEQIEAVVHFAGFKAVGESVQRPLAYYVNNLGSTFSILQAMSVHDVRKLVFSSSATVYGETTEVPMTEEVPTSATSPYGWTKVMIEQLLQDVATSDRQWRFALLRYFNPTGAHPSGTIGEDPRGLPNNLMPFISQVAVGRLDRLTIFGSDYPTPDGTALRDYVHVEDLAAGHVAALTKLASLDRPVSTWNLGTGVASSVLDALHAFERAVGRTLPYQLAPRRSGDIAASLADPTRAHEELGWRATKTLDDMCVDTWRWQQQNPDGLPDTGVTRQG